MKASWLIQREMRKTSDEKDVNPRRRRFRYTHGGATLSIQLAPMIDVTFLLLIFFLVTTTFERAEGILASDLPQTRAQPAVALPISPIVIRISQAGSTGDEYKIDIDRFEDVPRSFAELSGFLVQLQDQPGFDRSTPVVIVAGNNVRWDHVVGCWNAALRAECTKIAFADP